MQNKTTEVTEKSYITIPKVFKSAQSISLCSLRLIFDNTGVFIKSLI